MIKPWSNTWKLQKLIQRIPKVCKTKNFVYEIDFDSLPGEHAIKLENEYLPPSFNQLAEFGIENLNELEENGLITKTNHYYNQKEGIERHYYSITNKMFLIKCFNYKKVYSRIIPIIVFMVFLPLVILIISSNKNPKIFLLTLIGFAVFGLTILFLTFRKYVKTETLIISNENLKIGDLIIEQNNIQNFKLLTYKLDRIKIYLKTNEVLVFNSSNQWKDESNQEIFEIYERLEKIKSAHNKG